MSTNTADATMTIRNRRAAAIGFLIAYSAVALWAAPQLLVLTEVSNLNKWLPLLMSAGVVIAGIWGLIAATKPEVNRMYLFLATVCITAGTWLGAHFALIVGGDSWTSDHFQKTSYGLLTRALSFVAYVVLIQMITSGRVARKWWWILAAVLLLASILTPWIWSGIKVDINYIHQ